MSKQRIIIDMDGVMADVYLRYIQRELEETGRQIIYAETNGLTEKGAFPNCMKHVNERDFFRYIPLMKGAVEAVQKLNDQYEVFIVSAAMEFPYSLEEKYFWLQEHFPFLSWEQFAFCGSKTVIAGDIMIDDNFKNLDHFKGRTLLFTQPHNIREHDHPHERVGSWQEITHLLL